MNASEQFDAIVIGAGQAGVPLASTLAMSKRRTLLVEREHVGGTCVNEGCTPTKTMVASGRVAYLARRGSDYGVRTSDIHIEMTRIRERKRHIVESFRSGSQSRLEKTENVTLRFGEARFTDSHTIEIAATDGSRSHATAKWIFINAGCRPAVPKIEGLDAVLYLNSTSVMELDSVPEHLIVIGGGYIAIEFGQLFRRLGSRVTIIQTGKQLMDREDADVAQGVFDVLSQDGIEILLNTKAVGVKKMGTGIEVAVASNVNSRMIAASHLLVATGRVPNTDTLNVQAAGLKLDPRGFIQVNEKLETNVPGIYALGDIKGGPAFTHISYDDFRIVKKNLLDGGHASTTNRMVPYTVFMDPELGRIGFSETEARAGNKKIRIARMGMDKVARALEKDESRGFMKAIIDAETGYILGAAILGIDGGEIMSQIQLAMMGNLTCDALRDATFAHPTLAESLNNLFSLA